MTAKAERAAIEWARAAEARIAALDFWRDQTMAGSFTVDMVIALDRTRGRLDAARQFARSAGISMDGEPASGVTRPAAPVDQQIAGGG